MNDCDNILMRKMALMDGEQIESNAAEPDAHLAACENCRREIEEMETTRHLLGRQTRKAESPDLWATIGTRIGAAPATAFETSRPPFVLIGVLLVVFKLLEMIPARDFGWALKTMPFVLAIALFVFLRENPFKINTELKLEKQL
jgi:hypothetical protein